MLNILKLFQCLLSFSKQQQNSTLNKYDILIRHLETQPTIDKWPSTYHSQIAQHSIKYAYSEYVGLCAM